MKSCASLCLKAPGIRTHKENNSFSGYAFYQQQLDDIVNEILALDIYTEIEIESDELTQSDLRYIKRRVEEARRGNRRTV